MKYKNWTISKNPVSGEVTISRRYDVPRVYPGETFTHEIRHFNAANRDLVGMAKDWIDSH